MLLWKGEGCEMMVTTECEVNDSEVVFCLRDLDTGYQRAAEELGFARTEVGFARSFPAPVEDLDRIYANFDRNIGTMLRHVAREEQVPWESALHAWLKQLEGQDVTWFLGGSAALAVRGLRVEPRDIDIITDTCGAQRLGEIFAHALVEPVVPVKGWICDWFGRVFIEALIEWVGKVAPFVDHPEPSDFGPIAASRLERVVWKGYELRVPPLELQLAVSERRGLVQRAEAIRRFISQGK